MFLKDRLRALFSESRPEVREPAPANGRPVAPAPKPAVSMVRSSQGLQHFFQELRGRSGLNVLDLGESSQANIVAITDLGHRISSENLLYSLDTFFDGRPEDAASDPRMVEEFFDQALQYPSGHFDAALIWNCIEYLPPKLLQAFMARFTEILLPGAVVFALFHADHGRLSPDSFAFRITDEKTLTLKPRGPRPVVQTFNNRGLERLFGRFHSVKFFLTRDAFREVIVKR